MKPVLLFGAAGASDAVEALTKARVKGYTRSDGTYVPEHQDSRTEAQAPVTESRNTEWGFHGEAVRQHIRDKHGADVHEGSLSPENQKAAHNEAAKRFSDTANHLVQAGHFASHEEARDYLDSTHGRHLHDAATMHGGDASKVPWLKKDVADYKKKSGTPMKKSILLFGAAGASGAVEALTKAHPGKDGKLSASMREKIGEVGSKHREDMPADAFLLGAERKYPVKVKEDGGWKYSPDLLLAAARRARMEGRDDLAAEADKIRARMEGGGEPMKKAILLFGAPGASEALAELAKAQVQGYTRKDGTFVKPHTTSRDAAKPKPTVSTGAGHNSGSTAAFDEQKGRAMDDAIRWANTEKGQYGTDWMRENLASYLSKKWGIPESHAQSAVDERFR